MTFSTRKDAGPSVYKVSALFYKKHSSKFITVAAKLASCMNDDVALTALTLSPSSSLQHDAGMHTAILPCAVIHSAFCCVRSGRIKAVYQLNMAGYLKVLSSLSRSATALSKSPAVLATQASQTLHQRNCEFLKE